MKAHTDVSIRPAAAEDFEAWFALFEAVAGEGKWVGSEAPMDRVERRRNFDGYLARDDAVTLLAEVGDLLVGMLGVEVTQGIAGLGMCVDREWRGCGVGSALMDACVAWAAEHGAHKVVLGVWPHNTAARALYRKFGFEDEGRLRRHYRRRNGHLWDGISMGLVLDNEAPGSPHGG